MSSRDAVIRISTYSGFDGPNIQGVGCPVREQPAGSDELCRTTAQELSVAVMLTFAFKTRETGQPTSALCAASWNLSRSAPGIRAVTSSCEAVMVGLPSMNSNVSVALVSRLSGVMPSFPSSDESAMVKQPACAAAINSSGLVPTPDSKRVLNEYCVFA